VALAIALTGDGKYEAAAHMLRRGLRQLPDWRSLRLDAGEVFSGLEAYKLVAARLQEAAQQRPSDFDLPLLLGFWHYADGQYAKAAKVLWAAYDAGATDPLIKELLLAAERRFVSDAEEEEEPDEEETR
jgi:uncharacterized protein HemY